MPRRALALAFVLVGTSVAAACGGATTGVTTSRCVPGEQDACACRDGATSVQVCLADGTYGPCACATATGGEGTATGTSSSSSSGSSGSSSTSSSGSSAVKDAGVSAGTGDLADCQTGGNVLVLNGDKGDYIHPGYTKITVASWQANVGGTNHDAVHFDIEPSGQQYGLWWNVIFSTERMSVPLEVGTYTGAERAPFATYLKPGLEVTGDGRGCNTLSGTFQIHAIAWSGTKLSHLAATFEQHCEQGTPALRGCVVYDAPDGGS